MSKQLNSHTYKSQMNTKQTVPHVAGFLAGTAFVGGLMVAFAPAADAGPNCGQYNSKQERQICRGLRDGIRREIREDLRYEHGRQFSRYDRWHPSIQRPHGWDQRTRRQISDGIYKGLRREGLVD